MVTPIILVNLFVEILINLNSTCTFVKLLSGVKLLIMKRTKDLTLKNTIIPIQ